MSMKERKKMMGRVEDWIGSDATRADLIEIIAQVVLGEYTAKQLKEDVLSYDLNKATPHKGEHMTHPKQLDEVGITESYLRKMAKKEGVSYKKAVQIAMEQWGEYSLKLINKIVAEDIKTR